MVRSAADELFPQVYAELRRLAASYMRRERRALTLQPTALVHEAYLQLAGREGAVFQNRTHFLATAAIAMRQILAQQARRRNASKRTPQWAPASEDGASWDYDALDQALERLQAEAPELCRVVELRYYTGMSVEETASYLELSPRTVKRHWVLAKAWLNRELGTR